MGPTQPTREAGEEERETKTKNHIRYCAGKALRWRQRETADSNTREREKKETLHLKAFGEALRTLGSAPGVAQVEVDQSLVVLGGWWGR